MGRIKGSWARDLNWIKGFLWYCIHTKEVYILVANFVGGRTNINSFKVVILLLLVNRVFICCLSAKKSGGWENKLSLTQTIKRSCYHNEYHLKLDLSKTLF